MKQKLKILTAFLCGAIFFSGVSYAATELKARATDYKILVNGDELELSNPIMSINGSTHLPIRSFSEALGYEVGFDNGVITLDSENDKPNEDKLPAFNFTKLPITQTKYNVTVTVEDIKSSDIGTEFTISAKNNNNKSVNIYFNSNELGYNYGVNGKPYKTTGTVNTKGFPSTIKSDESVSGTVIKGKVPSDVENLIFRVSIDNIETITFYIDLTK